MSGETRNDDTSMDYGTNYFITDITFYYRVAADKLFIIYIYQCFVLIRQHTFGLNQRKNSFRRHNPGLKKQSFPVFAQKSIFPLRKSTCLKCVFYYFLSRGYAFLKKHTSYLPTNTIILKHTKIKLFASSSFKLNFRRRFLVGTLRFYRDHILFNGQLKTTSTKKKNIIRVCICHANTPTTRIKSASNTVGDF